jgi:hypothetical protein
MAEPTPSDRSDQPGYPWQQPYQPPPSPHRTGLPGWAIALIAGGALVCTLCVVGTIAAIGALTLLGGRVSEVFSEIESGLATPAPGTPIDTARALPIGEAAELPALHITVAAAHPLTDVRTARRPPLGRQYWVVEVAFENTSSRPITLSAFSSSIQDAAGNVYRYSSAAQRASPDPGLQVVETLRPGATISGLLFYEVPEDASELFFFYEDLIGGGQAVFKIK